MKKPWYMRRRVWLAIATVGYLGWRRMRTLAQTRESNRLSGAAL